MDECKELFLRAYAKINTGLDVIRRKENGYHEVKMILQTVDIFDRIHLVCLAREGSEIKLSINKQNLPTDEKNLVVKAALLLAKEYGICENLHIDLEKNIPMEAGMAGGSADAAATLVGLNELFQLGLSEERLQELGLRLGADIPFCIKGGTCLAEGIGEKLTCLPTFPKAHIVVVKPVEGISTRYVYENLNVDSIVRHPDLDEVISCLESGDLQGIGGSIENILENVTAKKMPIIEKIKKKMLELGSLGSNMSGSGPSIFGLFEDLDAANACAEYFRENMDIYELSDVFLTRTFEKGVEIMPPHHKK